MQYRGVLRENFFLYYRQGLIYGITDIASPGSLVEQAGILVQSGIKVLQYRNKVGSYLEKRKDLMQIKALQKQFEFLLIANDSVSLVKELDLDGVHLGQEDSSTEEAREVLGVDKLIGLSTHNPDQADQAATLPIDYIGVGPVFSSQTKPDAKEGGVEFLDYALRQSELPVVAIGGITLDQIPSLKKLGVHSLVMIQDLLAAQNREQKIQEAIQALHYEV